MSKKVKAKKDGEPERELFVPGEMDFSGTTITLSVAPNGKIHVGFSGSLSYGQEVLPGGMKRLKLTASNGTSVMMMGDLEDKPGPGSK